MVTEERNPLKIKSNNSYLVFLDRLLVCDMESCMQLLGSTMIAQDEDKFMRRVKKLFERSRRRRILGALRHEYRSSRVST